MFVSSHHSCAKAHNVHPHSQAHGKRVLCFRRGASIDVRRLLQGRGNVSLGT